MKIDKRMMINLEEIPLGYRFIPTDEEIITYYLIPKVEGEDMTWFSSVISEQDLYGEAPPWVIFQNQQGGDDDHIRYFYTRLKKKHESGEKIHRTVGKNAEYCWDGQDKGKDIYDHRTMTVIGRRKQYSLIRSNPKKDAGENSNDKKRKKCSNSSSSSSKDHDEVDESFGNWIMHEYSLVNPPSSSSSKDNQNYVMCRIRMKHPPKPSAAVIDDHDSIDSTTTPALPSTSTTAHDDYQNMSYTQMLHDQQQQDGYLPDPAHVAVPPLVPIGMDDYQINHDHSTIEDEEGYLLQHDQPFNLFQQDGQQGLHELVLMYEEQPAPMGESLTSVPEWECSGLNNRGGEGSSSSYHDQHQISDDNNINHDRILLVDLSANMDPLPPIILSNSMVDQDEQYYSKNKDIPPLVPNMSTRMQEEERRVMTNINGGGGRSDYLHNSISTIAVGDDDLDNGWTELVNFDEHADQNNYMNALNDDLVLDNGEYNTFWENHWGYPPPPQPPLPPPPSHHQAGF